MEKIERDQFPEFRKYDEKEKEERIKDWNGTQQVQRNGIEAFDTSKSKIITNGQYAWIKSFALIGLLALLVIAISSGTFGYIAWQDGTLLNPVALVCGNLSIDENSIVCEPTSCDCSPSLTCGKTDFIEIENRLDDFEGILEDLNCTG